MTNNNYQNGNEKGIQILYHDKYTQKICEDIKKAKRDLPANVAEKLIALVGLIKGLPNLESLNTLQVYHLHPLSGKRIGQYAVDVGGRSSGYRLIIIPLDSDGKEWKTTDIHTMYVLTRIIVVMEVSNHYE